MRALIVMMKAPRAPGSSDEANWYRSQFIGPTLRYYVVDRGDGVLIWLVARESLLSFKSRPVRPDDPAPLSFARFNRCCGTPVAADEAETLTGLYAPAALDRLRELVDEAPVLDADEFAADVSYYTYQYAVPPVSE